MKNRITMNQYQSLAQRTSPEDGHDRIDNGVLGLIGETGEIVDLYKKWIYQSSANTPIPSARIAEELGDVLWYMAELSAGLGAGLDEIIGRSFEDADACANRRAKKCTMRACVIGLSSRAIRINRAIRNGDKACIGAQMRWMLSGCAQLAWHIGRDLESIAADNIAKLKKRYPNGFEASISMGRYES